VLLASREHAHDMLLVSVLVSEVELKLSNVYCRFTSGYARIGGLDRRSKRELSASWCSCNHVTGFEDRAQFAFPVSFSRSNNGFGSLEMSGT
jgi:hypothetical protein